MNSAVGESSLQSGGYDPEHYSSLVRVEDHHFWFRARNHAIRALTSRICAAYVQGYRVLEVGCGTGNVLRHLEEVCRNGFVVGMDLYGEGFRFARQRTQCPLVQADASQPPFGCKFHLIGMFDVIEHVPDDFRLLRDTYELLAPGGALIVTVPAHMSLWSYFDEVSKHCRRYEKDELRSRLTGAGFSVEFLSEYMCSIAPLVWLKRRILAKRRHDAILSVDVVRDELRISPLLNAVLSLLTGLEVRWLRRRRRLPFGASLIAIARRRAD